MGEGLDGSLTMTRAAIPVRSVNVSGSVAWSQRDYGEVDISGKVVAAAQTAGTTAPFMISSFTGIGLADDWPKPGQSIGGGWTVGSQSYVERGDGKWDGSPADRRCADQGRLPSRSGRA